MRNRELICVGMKPDTYDAVVIDEIKHMWITVVDGPFFSVMPFPARDWHMFSHVR